MDAVISETIQGVMGVLMPTAYLSRPLHWRPLPPSPPDPASKKAVGGPMLTTGRIKTTRRVRVLGLEGESVKKVDSSPCQFISDCRLHLLLALFGIYWDDGFDCAQYPDQLPPNESGYTVSMRIYSKNYFRPTQNTSSGPCCSGAMSPGILRGDLLFLGKPALYKTGDIVSITLPHLPLRILRRVMETREAPPEIDLRQYILSANSTESRLPGQNLNRDQLWVRQLLLTKGDDIHEDDLGLYDGTEWIDGKQVVGKVHGCALSCYATTIGWQWC